MKTVRPRPPATVPVGVRSGVVTGAIAQLGLLGALAATVGMGAAGWVFGLAYGLTVAGTLVRALVRSAATTLGPANWVTLTRATLVGGVTALVADSFHRPAALQALVLLTAAALALDAVDGWVARRTGSVTAVGARFDMEVDAFLILVLSLYDARLLGGWVLLIGAARYLYVAAGWVLPWLRDPVPPRYWSKVVAAIQGVVLAVAMADLLPQPVVTAATAVALALLSESFGRDVWWQWRHRAARSAEPTPAETAAGRGRPLRRVAAAVTTVLAALLLWVALVTPGTADGFSVTDFARIPVEALIAVGLLLALPARAGRILMICFGLLVGVLSVVKILDLGFRAALARPFSPLSDWAYIGPAVQVLGDSIGQWGAVLAVIAAAALTLGILALVPLAARRLGRLTLRHRTAATRLVAALAVVWLASAALGLQAGPGTPVADAGTARLAYAQVAAIRSGFADQEVFGTAIADDPAAEIAPADLLTGLRGKDVLLVFAESYGRVAVQDSAFAPGVDAVLDAGTRRLTAAGFFSESAFLTSPTFGGISWLAHSTLQSGLWVDSQRRYDQLLAADRLTLTGAFAAAGWRTVLSAPANTENWPQATSFYHFEQVYDIRTMGYRGPEFGFATPPDQYTLAALQRDELADPARPPVMAEIDLLTGHTPWAPLPTMVDWADLGDGSVFAGMPQRAASVDEVWDDADQIRSAYGRSIEYTLGALISFVETYGGDDLVLIVAGDHQPATVVSGSGAGHDVPITVIARDPAVTDRMVSWGWQNGMNPGPQAPVWPMDTFRDRLLSAFGS